MLNMGDEYGNTKEGILDVDNRYSLLSRDIRYGDNEETCINGESVLSETSIKACQDLT